MPHRSAKNAENIQNTAFGREIYVASARTFLSHVPLWLEQRPCDMSRVQEIVKQKKDAPIFPGVISVFQYPPDVSTSIAVPQTRAIFDGQHRCLAILAILKVHVNNPHLLSLRLPSHPGRRAFCSDYRVK
jgi:hypothetical protein